MKKILLITSNLDKGGAEKWVLDTMMAMDRSDISIDAYYFGTVKADAFLHKYREIGVNIYIRGLNEGKLAASVCLWRDLRRFIREHGPYDAVHVNETALIHQTICMLTTHWERFPVRIIHSHNPAERNVGPIGKAARELLRKSVLRHATSIAACSQLVGVKKYGDKIIDDSRFIILKNGIDTEKFVYTEKWRREVRAELDLNPKDFVVLHIGRMVPEKNQLFLLDVFSVFRQHTESARMIIVGDGPKRQQITDKIKELCLEQDVRVLGWSEHPERFYSVADCFLFPSLYEGFATVLLEAQATGLTCYASDVISGEVNITGNVHFFSLKLPAEEWAKNIQVTQCRCQNTMKTVKDAGYDITETARTVRMLLLGERNENK